MTTNSLLKRPKSHATVAHGAVGKRSTSRGMKEETSEPQPTYLPPTPTRTLATILIIFIGKMHTYFPAFFFVFQTHFPGIYCYYYYYCYDVHSNDRKVTN